MDMTALTRRIGHMGSRRLIITAVGLNLLLVVVLGGVDLLTGQSHDRWTFIHTDNPVNGFTALYLVLAGVTSWGIWRKASGDSLLRDFKFKWIFPLMAAAFIFGGLDEWFSLHEWMGEHFSGFGEDTPSAAPNEDWFYTSSLVLVVYTFGAAGVFVLLLPVFSNKRHSMYVFLYGLGLQTAALISELFFPWAEEQPLPWVLVTYAEEASELFAALFYWLAMALILFKINGLTKIPQKGS